MFPSLSTSLSTSSLPIPNAYLETLSTSSSPTSCEDQFIQMPPSHTPHRHLAGLIDDFLKKCDPTLLPSVQKHIVFKMYKGEVPYLDYASGVSAETIVHRLAKAGFYFSEIKKHFILPETKDSEISDRSYKIITLPEDEYKLTRVFRIACKEYVQDEVYELWYLRHQVLKLIPEPISIIIELGREMFAHNISSLHLALSLDIANKTLPDLHATQNRSDPLLPYMHYQISVDLNLDFDEFKKEILDSLKLTRDNPKIFSGIILTGKENGIFAKGEYYEKKKEFLEQLCKNQKFSLTMRCGEYKSPFGSMQDSLKLQPNLARLLGGSCPSKNPRMKAVLNQLASTPTPILVNLNDWKNRSNESLSTTTPRPEYTAYHVPLLFYPGFSDITRVPFEDNFLCILEAHGYEACKKLVRDSMHHALHSGDSIFIRDPEHDRLTLHPLFETVEGERWEPSTEAQEFLDQSDKARFQVELERKLVNFEIDILRQNITVRDSQGRVLPESEIDVFRVDSKQ